MRVRHAPSPYFSTLMCLPGSIFVPHHGQLVSWCGDAAPARFGLAAVGRLHRLVRIAGPVGGRAAADPQADAERRLPPAGVAVAQGRAADVLAGADERRRPLELLERQEPQGVPHQHGHAVLAGSPLDHPLQAAQAESVGRQTQVGFGLAAAGRKPQQVGGGVGRLAAFGVVELGDARQVQEDEGELERIPGAVLRDVDGRHVGRLVASPSHPLGEQGVRPLEPHRPVHEQERLPRLVLRVEQVQPLLDPLQRRAAAGNGLLGDVLEVGQTLGGVGDPYLLPLDPVPVGVHQRLELRAELLRVRLGQRLHVEDHALQLGEGRVDLGVGGPGRGRLRNLVGRHDLGPHPDGVVRVGGPIDVDADPVPHSKLDVPPVDHRQQVVLPLHSGVRAGQFEDGVPLVDHRRPADALGHQFRLERPAGVFLLLRLLLLVDQEEGDAPVVGAPADESLDDNFRCVGIDHNRIERAFGERQPVLAATGIPLPNEFRVAGFGLLVFALLPKVLTPDGGHVDLGGLRVHREGHPEGGRDQRLGLFLGGRLIGRAVLGRVLAPQG